jgi:hypothetical protein
VEGLVEEEEALQKEETLQKEEVLQEEEGLVTLVSERLLPNRGSQEIIPTT